MYAVVHVQYISMHVHMFPWHSHNVQTADSEMGGTMHLWYNGLSWQPYLAQEANHA